MKLEIENSDDEVRKIAGKNAFHSWQIFNLQ